MRDYPTVQLRRNGHRPNLATLGATETDNSIAYSGWLQAFSLRPARPCCQTDQHNKFYMRIFTTRAYRLQQLGYLLSGQPRQFPLLDTQRFNQLQRILIGDLPAPHRLASSDLSEGYQRLNQAIRNGNVVATGRDGMYRLKLKPSAELLKHCLITFNRLDWPLDTTELEVACWRAAYIFQAIAILERWTGNGMLYPLHGHLVVILALHDYLAYVREDHGLGLQANPGQLHAY